MLILSLLVIILFFLIYYVYYYSDRDISISKQIPLNIFQTWHTKDLPPKMKECVEKLKRDNPEFKHYLYDDEMCRQYIINNYDKRVLYAYDNLKPGTFKADLWRYCLLYKEGGIYLDIKYQCENGFALKDVINDELFCREYWNNTLHPHAVYTGIMIAKPKNNKFGKMIDRICENVETKFYDEYITGQTGPYLFASFFTKQEQNDMKYTYYEDNGLGFIRPINSNKIILSFYPEYRDEQKKHGKTSYWKEMFANRDVYAN